MPSNIIGTGPNQVPTNADLGTMAYQDAALYQNIQQSQFGFKNRIINGAMMIDQRNAGASVTPSVLYTTYTLDRWITAYSVGSKFSVQQSTTAPAGFVNSALITSLSAYTVGSGENYNFGQIIEGLNMADLGWGSASAKAVTLSFWVRSSLTGTFGGAFQNSVSNRSYPFSYTISSANTWEQKTVTIAGDTTGTWLTTNGVGARVYFGLGAGSTVSGAAGSWAEANYYSATGATSVVGTNGATFYITGVQLEKGSTATSFDYRPYGTELALCQRYFTTNYPIGTAIGTAAGNWMGFSGGDLPFGTGCYARIRPYFSIQMRASPTVSIWDTSGNSGKAFYNGAANSPAGINSTSSTGFQFGATNQLSAPEVTFAWAATAEL